MNKKQRKKKKSIMLRNKKLCKKYPFLIPRYAWTGKVIEDYDYSYTEWDDIPDGWKIAFGDMLLKELGAELKRCNFLDKYRIVQIKEKYGELRLYDNGVPRGCNVWNIIEDYSALSRNICISCGKPDVPHTVDGWIMPLCKKCFCKNKYNHPDDYEKCYRSESRMQDIRCFYRWNSFGKKHTETVDISARAEKIRTRWYKRRKSY